MLRELNRSEMKEVHGGGSPSATCTTQTHDLLLAAGTTIGQWMPKATAPTMGAVIGATVGGVVFAELGPGDVFAAAITAGIADSVVAAMSSDFAGMAGSVLGTAIANAIWDRVCPSDTQAIPTNGQAAQDADDAAYLDDPTLWDSSVHYTDDEMQGANTGSHSAGGSGHP